MKKEIILEINRMNELMGLPLIYEVTLPAGAIKGIDGIIGVVKSIGDDIFKFVRKETPEVKKIIDRVERVVASNPQLTRAASLTDDEIKILIRNLTSSGLRNIAWGALNRGVIWTPTFTQDFVKTFVDLILDKPSTYLKQINKLRGGTKTFWGNYDKPEDVPDAVKKIANEVFIILRTRIDETVETTSPKIWREIQDTIKRSAGINSSYDEISGLSDDLIQSITRTYGAKWFKSLKIFLKNVTDGLKFETTLLDELLSVLKTLQNSAELRESETIALYKRVDDLLFRLTKRKKENFKEIDEWLKVNDMDNLLSPLRLPIMKDGYAKALAISTGKAYEGLQYGLKKLWARRKETYKQLFDVILPGRWFPKTIQKRYSPDSYWSSVASKWKDIITSDDFKRLRVEYLSGQTKTGAEWKEIAKRLGVPKMIYDAGIEYALNFILFGVFAGFLDFLTDFFGFVLRQIPMIRGIELIKKQAEDYYNRKTTIKEKSNSEINEVVNGVKAIIEWADVYALPRWKNLENLIMPYWDDTLKIFGRFRKTDWEKELYNEEWQNWLNQSEVKLIETKKEVKAKLDSLNTGQPLKVDSILSNDAIKVEPTPKGFENFLRGLGLTGTLRSDSTGTDSEGKDWYWDQEANTFQPL